MGVSHLLVTSVALYFDEPVLRIDHDTDEVPPKWYPVGWSVRWRREQLDAPKSCYGPVDLGDEESLRAASRTSATTGGRALEAGS
jgi:hypothetical protein